MEACRNPGSIARCGRTTSAWKAAGERGLLDCSNPSCVRSATEQQQSFFNWFGGWRVSGGRVEEPGSGSEFMVT